MFKKFSTRREFLKYGNLSLLFLLNSCSNIKKKLRISFQSSFYPDSFKEILPASWEKANINYGEVDIDKNQEYNSDLIVVNDGWINSLNFDLFQNINYLTIYNNLDERSKDYLKTFDKNKANKIFPIGVIPYAVIIKNNKDLIISARNSWEFLLSKKLAGKIILPKSPRIIMSIAKKIDDKNSLGKLRKQTMFYTDKNALNWLINSPACVAILPYSICLKYLKIDSRLSIVFPEKGVPLMWNFLINKSKLNDEILVDWINSLEKKISIDKLANAGWYLPFKNEYSQSKYNPKISKNGLLGPSKICWQNSWSFPSLDSQEKIKLEKFWSESLTP